MRPDRQPRPGHALLGSVVETPAGSFVPKLTGPGPTVEGWSQAFDGFIDSLEPE